MTKEIKQIDTLKLQLHALDAFMSVFGYVRMWDGKYKSTDGNNIFNLDTAVRLYNETRYIPFKKYKFKFMSPVFNPEIKLGRYQVDVAQAIKPFVQVKLCKIGEEIVASSHWLKFSKFEYEKIFL